MSDAASGRQAPDSLERKLVGAFREHHASLRGQRRWMRGGLALALAVAAILSVVAFLSLRPGHVRAPVISAPAVVATVESPKTIPPAPVSAAPRVRHRRRPAPEPRQQEVTTGFLSLDAAGGPPTSGEVIRMEMPRSTLALFGLPVDERRASVPVRADVLFGDDGMAHAVRFVTTTSYEIQPGR
jgi:hypothetical protein